MKSHWSILIAVALAIITGLIIDEQTMLFGISILNIFDLLGHLFLNALKMLIVPLIVSSMIVGISGLGGSGRALGRLGVKTISYYALTSLCAITIGLLVVNLLQPGQLETGTFQTLGLETSADEMTQRFGEHDTGTLATIFLRMVPENIVAAAASGQMLGLIVFSLLYGFFITRLPTQQATVQTDFWQGVFAIMLSMTHLIMRFAPIGVFALVTQSIAVTGLDVLLPLMKFFFTVLLGLTLHLAVILPCLLWLLGKTNPLHYYQAISPALLTAFSTASSSATLPITLDCVENRLGISNRVTSFVLPLGATVNMDGTALYECVVVLFIAQIYGVDLAIGTQFSIVLLALLTSIGVAGVPAASLVAIAIILTAVGLPLEGIGLILAVDRLLDMARTAVNVASDACGTVIIARSETS
jgi:Na+/H+-dicarboxylate symporter